MEINKISIFNRFISLLILFTFIYTGCPIFTSPNVKDNEPEVYDIHTVPVGLGSPKYFYIDDDNNFSETDTGRTIMFIEDNKYAEGVFILSDILSNNNSRVILFDTISDNIFSFYFNENTNFPYSMEIKTDNTVYYALLSQYRQNYTYDIVFQHEGNAEVMRNLILNPGIFDIEADEELSEDANLRLKNIIIAMGLLGSIAYYLDDAIILTARSLTLKSFLQGVKKAVVDVIRPVAAAVAIVGGTIGGIVNPAIGFTIALVGTVVYALTFLIERDLEILIDRLPDDKQPGRPGQNPEPGPIPIIIRYNHDPAREFINGEEFHIPLGGSMQLDIWIPGFNRNEVDNSVFIPHWFEPGVPYGTNEHFFEREILYNGTNIDVFQLNITRRNITGHTENGKIAFGIPLGILFNSDITINGNVQEIEFKLLNEDEAMMRNDVIAIWFCIDPDCPDYID